MALVNDLLLLLPFLRKKLTVRGMMGQTQGVSNASKPPRKHAQNKNQSELLFPSVPLASWSVNLTGAHRLDDGRTAATVESAARADESTLAVKSSSGIISSIFSSASLAFLSSAFSSSLSFWTCGSLTLPEKLNDSVVGGVQVWSLQLMNSISPSML